MMSNKQLKEHNKRLDDLYRTLGKIEIKLDMRKGILVNLVNEIVEIKIELEKECGGV